MPYRLFDNAEHDARKARVRDLYLAGLNRICAEPFEDCLARDAQGGLCLEIKSPQDIEREVGTTWATSSTTLSPGLHRRRVGAGTWGVETEYPRVYRCGSSAVRGGR